jgi:dihydroorotate dehydrogenase (NAD+) catalytic subunit
MVKPNTGVNLAGIEMKNPITVASGTFGYEYNDFFDLSKLGAIVPKGITLLPKEGNPTPRIFETASGMLNAIGLQNPGAEVFINEVLPEYEKFKVPVIVNISGESPEDYSVLAKQLTETGKVAGIEINVSCPNLKKGGSQFGADPVETAKIVNAVRKATNLPIITKLTPNVTDITAIAKAAEEAGSDAISLINTILGTAINTKTRKFEIANVTGGLSGPAIKPVALRMVWQCSNAVKIPILAMGGISNAEDAIEFILAGATAVAVGTENFVNPKACQEIVSGIEKYLLDNKINDIKEIIGAVSR